ncbi:MAG TPA: hypothetical protein VK814_11185 [Acidobacteriaceae bacterium]|nr:hypothetical protein [Acidobacteriaceae bacterium]
MTFNSFSRTIYIAVIFTVLATTVRAWAHKSGQQALVRFLATSTIIRSSSGPNEDTYLAELTLTPKSDPLLVRLIDLYPSAASALPKAVLISAKGSVLRVLRDTECDRPYDKIILRTAPGDPMAILQETLSYLPPLDPVPAPDAIVPCYRVVRR